MCTCVWWRPSCVALSAFPFSPPFLIALLLQHCRGLHAFSNPSFSIEQQSNNRMEQEKGAVAHPRSSRHANMACVMQEPPSFVASYCQPIVLFKNLVAQMPYSAVGKTAIHGHRPTLQSANSANEFYEINCLMEQWTLGTQWVYCFETFHTYVNSQWTCTILQLGFRIYVCQVGKHAHFCQRINVSN